MNAQPSRRNHMPSHREPDREPDRELSGDEATAALADAAALFTPAPRVFATLKDVQIEQASGKVLITAKYRGKATNEFTVRLSRAWAEVVFGRLARVLGK